VLVVIPITYIVHTFYVVIFLTFLCSYSILSDIKCINLSKNFNEDANGRRSDTMHGILHE
jgi:hypothetical protein